MFLIGRRKKVDRVDPGSIHEGNLNSITDYTLLKPNATRQDIDNFLNVAHKNCYFAVCVNPINVAYVKKYLDLKLKSTMKVCTVIGFPLGEHTTDVKVCEAKRAISDGADEIDMVAAISRIKSHDWDYVKNDISRVVRASKGKVVKVIIETAYLTRDEIIQMTKICIKARADFVKTSTGFANGGATPDIIELIASVAKNKIQVKASGGIASKFDAMNMVRMGATRIGTSRVL